MAGSIIERHRSANLPCGAKSFCNFRDRHQFVDVLEGLPWNPS